MKQRPVIHIDNTLIVELTQCGKEKKDVQHVNIDALREYWPYIKKSHVCRACRKKSPGLERTRARTHA